MTFAVTYQKGTQQVSEAAFMDNKDGLIKAIRFIRKMERIGYKCEPTEIILKHKLNHLPK